MKTVTAEQRTSACVINTERSSNKSFFENADKPTLHGLSYALRHPDTWPEGFVWDFNDCNKCAMGLAHRLWKAIPVVGRSDGASVMARRFAMPYKDSQRIFLSRVGKTTRFYIFSATAPRGSVTPEMVADQIDAYIATAE